MWATNATNGGQDVLIQKFDIFNRTLEWSTTFGGDGDDIGRAIFAEENGNVWVTGGTFSTDFPVVTPSGAHAETYSGNGDVFVTHFRGDANQDMTWSTYYGGNEDDEGQALDYEHGNLYITGKTKSESSFLFANSQSGNLYQQNVLGNSSGSTDFDAFILAFNPWYKNIYSTYFGGGVDDSGNGIAVHGYQSIYLVGDASSNENTFPLANKTGSYYDGLYAGSADGFISSIPVTTALTGIEEAEEALAAGSLLIYPNPASQGLQIIYEAGIDEEIMVEILDLSGKIVSRERFKGTKGRNQFSTDVSAIASGFYLIRISSPLTSLSASFVKQ